jgi:hypothetical protein
MTPRNAAAGKPTVAQVKHPTAPIVRDAEEPHTDRRPMETNTDGPDGSTTNADAKFAGPPYPSGRPSATGKPNR